MFETFDSERKRRRDRQRRVSAAAVAGLPSTDLDSDDDTDESDKAEEETLAPSLRDERASKPMLPTSTPPGSDSGESFPSSHEQHPEQYRRRRRKRPSEVQVGVVPMLTRAKDNNSMQVTPNEGRVEDMIAKTEYSHLHYSRARQSQDEKIMQERKVDEQWRKQERREQQHQRQKLQQRSSDADLAHLHALAVARQYGSQAVASQSVGRVAWTPVARPRQQRLSASPMETIQSTTPLAQTSRTAVAEEEAGGASTSGNDSRSGDKEKEHPPLTLSPSSSATSLQQRISRSNSGAFANAVNPADVPTLRRGPTPKEILGPNSVELPASDRGKDLYGTILWSRTGQDMAPIGIMTPNNRGQIEGDPAPSFNTLGQHVSPSSISERICIQKFGISYHEIISKLVMEQGVLSEAESRMVLLLLSEPSDQTKLPETQMRMLRAVVEIETRGISRATIHAFRRELAAVAVEVAQQTEMVRALAENDVLLARATDGAPKDKQTDTSALLNHPGAISPQGKITLESALEEAFQDLLAASDANSASSLSQQRHQQHPESPVAMFTGGTASASLASGLNALVLKEQESLLFPVTEELTGEHSSAGNTAHHQEKSESNTPLRALSQRTVLPNLKDDVDEEESDDGYSSVYDKMTRLQKSAPSHTIAASPSHSSFSVASGMSSMTSHWDKQDTTKRMMRVPVIDRVMSKIAKRISEIPRHKLLGRKQVILLGSGAYNPIHKMHLRMLYIARRYLEERTEFEVLGGLVSPAHATDVRSRFRQKPKEIIPPKHRLAMARAAVGDSTVSIGLSHLLFFLDYPNCFLLPLLRLCFNVHLVADGRSVGNHA